MTKKKRERKKIEYKKYLEECGVAINQIMEHTHVQEMDYTKAMAHTMALMIKYIFVHYIAND